MCVCAGKRPEGCVTTRTTLPICSRLSLVYLLARLCTPWPNLQPRQTSAAFSYSFMGSLASCPLALAFLPSPACRPDSLSVKEKGPISPPETLMPSLSASSKTFFFYFHAPWGPAIIRRPEDGNRREWVSVGMLMPGKTWKNARY